MRGFSTPEGEGTDPSPPLGLPQPSERCHTLTLLPNASTCQRGPQGPSPPLSGLPQLRIRPPQLTQPSLGSRLSEGSPRCARPPPSLCVSCLFSSEGPPSSHPFPVKPHILYHPLWGFPVLDVKRTGRAGLGAHQR